MFRLGPIVVLITKFRLHLTNFSAFTAVQAASYLIPVVTIPYFARTLSITGMGHIAIAGAAALAGGVLMDYGILQSGTRFAATNTSRPVALSEYLTDTSLLKIALFLSLLGVFGLTAIFVPVVSDHFWVYLWSIVSAGAMCLFPHWLFQGLLIIPEAAKILVCTRIFAAVSALALIRDPSDTYVVPMTQAIAALVALGAAAIFFRRHLAMEFKYCGVGGVRALLQDNWKLFSATAWGAIHTYGAVLILGSMLPARSVGLYSIAERISQALVSVFNIAAQTGFPSFVRGYARKDALFRKRVWVYVAAVSLISALCLGVIFSLRFPIYEFFSGEKSEVGTTIFSIWLVSSFFTVICVSLSPIMVAMRLDDRLARVYRFTGICFLFLAPTAVYYWGAVGMALAAVFPQCFMAIYFVVTVRNALNYGFSVCRSENG